MICKRYPPIPIITLLSEGVLSSDDIQPTVTDDDGCGEYKQTGGQEPRYVNITAKCMTCIYAIDEINNG